MPAHVPLAGYSRRGGKPSAGTHDAVGARALVLRGDGPPAALVSADLLIIDEPLMQAVRERLAARGWPGDGVILLGATHTHAGPGAYGRRFFEKISMGHFDPRVLDHLAETIAGAVLAADAAAGPVRMAGASVQAPEFILNRMEDGGGTDPELIVLGWYRPGAEAPFAVLVTYSAHPTVLGPSNMQLSGEYPGAVMRHLEAEVPGAIALFLAGAMGDQGPVKGGDGGFGRVDEIGRGLAGKAAGALRAASPQPVERVSAREERMPLPPARVRINGRRLPRWLSARLVDDDATLPVVRVNGTVFVGAPCDLASPFGLQLKQAARDRNQQAVVVGFANDYIGYCVPAAWYHSDEYEAGMAFNGPDTGELITQRLIDLLNE